MAEEFEERVREAIAHPKNMGEMADADAVGTVGNPECGDMLRLWLKFGEKDGRRVIDRASFQSFGCQTAVAVASMATELLAGRTLEEARTLGAADLSGALGPLPPMKIHCGQMVEGALRDALEQDLQERGDGVGAPERGEAAKSTVGYTLSQSLEGGGGGKKVKVIPLGE